MSSLCWPSVGGAESMRGPPWAKVNAAGHGIDGGFGVPLAAFTFAHGGPRIDAAPATLGQHNEEIFAELSRERREARAG